LGRRKKKGGVEKAHRLRTERVQRPRGRLNHAIIDTLGAKHPQTTRQIAKNIKNIPELRGTSCSTVNKRVRALLQDGYLKKTTVQQRVGGLTNYYELTLKAHLAKFLISHNAEELFGNITDEAAIIILADLIEAAASS
jgi:DNA-binding MarR family transcriptional regulator